MKEQWADTYIQGDSYQVSNLGNVRGKDRVVNSKNGSTRTVKGRELNPYTTANGYKMVSLGLNMSRKRSCVFVHRLVASAFCDNPENRKIVHHKDGDKANNTAQNLEWSTKSENFFHAMVAGCIVLRRGKDCHWSKITESKVLEIKSLLSQGVKPRPVAAIVGVTPSIVYGIRKGVSWKHIGINLNGEFDICASAPRPAGQPCQP